MRQVQEVLSDLKRYEDQIDLFEQGKNGLMGVMRRHFLCLAGASVLCPMVKGPATAQSMRIDGFEMQPEAGWRFFTDNVMGGISTGQVVFVQDSGHTYARMTGRVSTANRGGFIQMRLDLDSAPLTGTTGVRVIVRGNDQRYFVHLRTTGAVLPWQYYQVGFDVTRRWAEARLPFAAFRPSGRLLRATLRPESVTSVAVVAYGRDHEAEIDIRAIGFF